MERPGQDILISFFRGTCPPEEEQAIRIYLAMNIDKEYVEACLLEAFPDLTDEHDPNISQQEVSRVWNKLESRKQEYPTIQLKPRTKWYAYAAAVAFVLVSTASLFILKDKFGNKQSAQIAWQQISAGPGKPKTVQLADNSSVTLFPGSAIQVPRNFNQSDRQVKLTGRAFFKITHNAAKPFYVSAQQLITKDLGTSFEINTSETGSENTVTLHTGKASISYSGKQVAMLNPNQQFHFDRSTKQFKVIPVNAASTISWLNGELGYDQAPLKSIVYDLEKWYGVHITAATPALLNQKVTISFKDLPVDAVLHMLSESADFTYTVTGKQITIKERGMDTN